MEHSKNSCLDDGYVVTMVCDGYLTEPSVVNLETEDSSDLVKLQGVTPQDIEEWRQNFETVQKDKDFKVIKHYKEHQLNIKLTQTDAEDLDSINKHFFENEASSSMMGRILIRKGITFYKNLMG